MIYIDKVVDRMKKGLLWPKIVLCVLVLATFVIWLLLNNKFNSDISNNYDYLINIGRYDMLKNCKIYKKNNEIQVYYEPNIVCTNPCPVDIKYFTLSFTDDHMKIINSFFDVLFSNRNQKEIELREEDLDNSQKNIVKSIIYNDESILESSLIIITDSKTITYRDDGGSYIDIYYEFDFSNNTVKKIQVEYVANLDENGNSSTNVSKLYQKEVPDSLASEIKILSKKILDKTDEEQTISYYIIKSNTKEKKVYNQDDLTIIKKILNELDGEREVLFAVKSVRLSCISPELVVYDDNTYEYNYTYTSDETRPPIPKTGTYDYNINEILDLLTDNKNISDSYYIFKGDERLFLSSYEPLEEFIKSIGINIHTCINQQK